MTRATAPAPRRDWRRGRGVLAATIVTAALSATVATAAPGGGDRGGPRGGDGGPATFDISGSVDGLLPTIEATLPLLLENPERRAIAVVSLDVEVGDPDGACAADDLVLRLPALPIIVPGRGELVVDVVAELADDVDDSCQGIVWPLTWSGTAERA